MIHIKQFTFNYFSVNTYLIYDETSEAALIDCGCMNKTEEAALSSFIKDNSLVIKRLLSTHYHFDHVIGNSFVSNTYHVKPEMHRGERAVNIPTLSMQAMAFGINKSFEDIEPERFIEDGDGIKFGNTILTALLVPGHSPASLAFYCAAEGVVFTGDALFYGSIGRTDLWGGDYHTLISAIRAKLLTLPDITQIYPGHGPASSIFFEKENNPYL